MAQLALNRPDNPHRAPNTGDGTEFGDLFDEIVRKCQANFVEVYGGGTGAVTSGVGAAAGTGVAVSEQGNGAIHKTVFTLTAVSVTTTDAGAAGAGGGLKIYDFPEGVIKILGSTVNLTTLAGVGGITDTAAVVHALGSVTAAADATLTSTEADIVASTAGTLTGGIGTFAGKGANTTAMLEFDGHTTALDLFLNCAVPDAGSASNDTMIYTGTITIVWANVGDF